MTDKLEKKFFDTFGIEPRTRDVYGIQLEYTVDEYPQITDHKLLELIIVIMMHEDLYGFPRCVTELKTNILKQLMETYNKFSTCVTCDGDYQQTARDIKQSIQLIFKETK